MMAFHEGYIKVMIMTWHKWLII